MVFMDLTEQPELIRRLAGLRGTIRRRLLVYGGLAVLGGAVASFLVMIALDWLFWLPPALRVMSSMLFLTGLGTAVAYWIVRPLRARLGLDEIAARLERHFVPLRDRLSSAVDFVEHRDAGSSDMMRQVVANTNDMVRNVPLESSLSFRPLAICGVLFLVTLAVLLTGLVLSPNWVRTGLYRYVYPLGEVEWPRRVSIVPLTGTETVAMGEAVSVRMAIARGLHENLRGVVHLREAGGEVTALAMHRDRDGAFFATIDAVTADLEYWFEAGDDSTRDRPFVINMVRRPEVVEALARVEPPPYAARARIRTHALSEGPVSAPTGGQVTILVQASKPIPLVPPGSGAGLRLENGKLIPLAVDPGDQRRLSSRFEVTEDVHFRIELRDEGGFANLGAARHYIHAVPDLAPRVTLLEPTSLVELTPQGSVPLRIRVEDDFGVVGLDLHAERIADGQTYAVPLTDRLRTMEGDKGVEAVAQYLWRMQPMRLVPGDMLACTAEAKDNRVLADFGGQVGSTAPLRIKIISPGEFGSRLRTELAMLEDRLRRITLEETDLLDRTTGLVQPGAAPVALTNAEGEQTFSLAALQARLVRRGDGLARRFDSLAERMRRNHAGDQQARDRITSSGTTLRQVALGPMTSAGASLMEAGEQTEAHAQQVALRKAVREETAAVDRLRALIRSMSQWGDFEGLVGKTRDILDRQVTIRTETAELGKALLGRSLASLTAEEAAALKKPQRQQEQLSTDVEQLLTRMRHLFDAAAERDPAGAEAIEGALRVARSNDLLKRVRAAAEAIQANRTAAASIDQKVASEAIRKMIVALQERQTRELARLRKKLHSGEEQVAELIEQQQALRAATHEAGLIEVEESAFASLEQEQRTLKQNTRILGEELDVLEQAARAGQTVRAAAVPMGQAENKLAQKQPEVATAAQTEAVTLLTEAREQLETLAREAAEQEFRRSLTRIHEGLKAVLAAQREVNRGIDGLRSAIEARGRFGRPEARQASKLSRDQLAARRLLDEGLPDLQDAPVYEWVLRRVAEWMELSRRRLDTRQVDTELVSLTTRIARELEKLIDAIAEAKSLPFNTEFAEAEEGGAGGPGGIIFGKPVPTVAELLVIKTMQQDINERTRTLHQSLGTDAPGEELLRELKIVGEDQAEVSRLTDMLTRRAR